MVAISVYLFPLPDPLQIVAHVAMAAALAVTLWTGGDYVVQAVRLRGSRGKGAAPS